MSNFSEKENKILIKIFVEKNILYSSFSNTKELQQITSNENSGGIGIANLKRRLELLYPKKYELDVKNEDEFYETKLNIDLS